MVGAGCHRRRKTSPRIVLRLSVAIAAPGARLTQKIWVPSGARFAPSGRLGRLCGSYVAGRPRCRKSSPLIALRFLVSIGHSGCPRERHSATLLILGGGGARGGGVRHPLATWISKKRQGLPSAKHRCIINCKRTLAKTTFLNERRHKLKEAFSEITILA